MKAQNITLLKIVHYRYTPQTAYAGSAIYSEQNVHAEHKVDAVFTVSSVCIVDWAVRKKSSGEFSGFFFSRPRPDVFAAETVFSPTDEKAQKFQASHRYQRGYLPQCKLFGGFLSPRAPFSWSRGTARVFTHEKRGSETKIILTYYHQRSLLLEKTHLSVPRNSEALALIEKTKKYFLREKEGNPALHFIGTKRYFFTNNWNQGKKNVSLS